MKRLVTLFGLAFLFFCTPVKAQFSKYVVRFKDKGGTPFTIANPSAYLSAKSIARRTKQGIAIDSTDLPITPRYLDSIRSVPNVTILNSSKWLNQVLIQTTSAAALAKIQTFPFVITSDPVSARFAGPVNPTSDISAAKLQVTFNTVPTNTQRQQNTQQTLIDYGNATAQVRIHNGDFLHNWGFRGEAMNIAVMDAGFSGYNINPSLDSLRINNQIKETWDYVAGNATVEDDHPHGMYCMSIIGVNKPGLMVGTAPKANFYLYRTEDVASEYPIEEQNWVAAAERADSLGVDLFTTSLGYITFDNAIFNHTYAQRNGNTAMMTIGGDLAAKKGIIVMNSAGNNGNDPGDGKFIAVPADGDSIVTLGACNTSGLIGNFSAWGPNSAGLLKPNLTSVGVGTSFIGVGGNPSNGNGTSFSCPNMAGLITCLLQAFYEGGNMEIINAVQQASDKFSTPDARYGYGIPDMKKAFVLLLKRRYSSIVTLNANCITQLLVNVKASSAMQFELERRGPGDPAFSVVKRFNSASSAFTAVPFTLRDTLSYQSTGAVAYRLKHIIGTDTSFYYDVPSVFITQPCGNDKIVIAPNPVKNNLSVTVGTLLNLSSIAVRISESSGRTVYIQNNAPNNININTQRWAAGVYLVEIIGDGKTIATKRVIKE